MSASAIQLPRRPPRWPGRRRSRQETAARVDQVVPLDALDAPASPQGGGGGDGTVPKPEHGEPGAGPGRDGRPTPSTPRPPAACPRPGRRLRGSRRPRRPRRPAVRRRRDRRPGPCRCRRDRTRCRPGSLRHRGPGRPRCRRVRASRGSGRPRSRPARSATARGGLRQQLEGAVVAGPDHRRQNRRVEGAAREPPRLGRPLDQQDRVGRDGHGPARRGVQARHLARRPDAAPALLELLDPCPGRSTRPADATPTITWASLPMARKHALSSPWLEVLAIGFRRCPPPPRWTRVEELAAANWTRWPSRAGGGARSRVVLRRASRPSPTGSWRSRNRRGARRGRGVGDGQVAGQAHRRRAHWPGRWPCGPGRRRRRRRGRFEPDRAGAAWTWCSFRAAGGGRPHDLGRSWTSDLRAALEWPPSAVRIGARHSAGGTQAIHRVV